MQLTEKLGDDEMRYRTIFHGAFFNHQRCMGVAQTESAVRRHGAPLAAKAVSESGVVVLKISKERPCRIVAPPLAS